jgi:hypothetical protein
MRSYDQKQSTSDLILGYTEWLHDLKNSDWKLYLLTFQFKHFGANSHHMLRSMHDEIERFYSVLLTRIVRRPRRLSQLDRLPRLIAVPDRPISKRRSDYRLADILPNDGVHYHGLFCLPPNNRLTESLVRHLRRHRKQYLGALGVLVNYHARRIRKLEDGVVDYVFKHVKRRSFSSDDILVLPKSHTELRGISARRGRNSCDPAEQD